MITTTSARMAANPEQLPTVVGSVEIRAGFQGFNLAELFVLNRYREEMAHAIESAGGVVNEFVGDGVMALFGLDSDVDAGCRHAMAAARAILERLEHLNRTLVAE